MRDFFVVMLSRVEGVVRLSFGCCRGPDGCDAPGERLRALGEDHFAAWAGRAPEQFLAITDEMIDRRPILGCEGIGGKCRQPMFQAARS